MELGEAYIRIRTDLKNLRPSMEEIKSSYERVGQKAKEMQERHQAAMDQLASKAKWAFLGIAGAMTGAVYAAARFEDTMEGVYAAMSQRHLPMFDKYKTAVRELSKETGIGTEQLAGAMKRIVQSSTDAADVSKVMAVAAKSSIAAGVDAGVAADALLSIMAAYKMKTEEATEVNDKLLVAVQKGAGSYGELAQVISKVATVAAMCGVSLDELLTMVAMMGRRGIAAGESLQSLTTIMRTFLEPTAQAKTVARELGVTLDLDTLRTRGLAAVLGDLSRLTEEETAQLFPNIRGLKALATATEDATEQRRTLGDISAASGATERVYAERMAGTSNELQKLKASATDFAVTVGNALLPMANQLINVLQSLIKFLDSFGGGTASAVLKIGALAAALAFLTGKFSGVGPALNSTSYMTQVMNGALSKTPSAVNAVSASMSGFSLAMGAVGVAAAAMIMYIQSIENETEKLRGKLNKFNEDAKEQGRKRQGWMDQIRGGASREDVFESEEKNMLGAGHADPAKKIKEYDDQLVKVIQNAARYGDTLTELRDKIGQTGASLGAGETSLKKIDTVLRDMGMQVDRTTGTIVAFNAQRGEYDNWTPTIKEVAEATKKLEEQAYGMARAFDSVGELTIGEKEEKQLQDLRIKFQQTLDSFYAEVGKKRGMTAKAAMMALGAEGGTPLSPYDPQSDEARQLRRFFDDFVSAQERVKNATKTTRIGIQEEFLKIQQATMVLSQSFVNAFNNMRYETESKMLAIRKNVAERNAEMFGTKNATYFAGMKEVMALQVEERKIELKKALADVDQRRAAAMRELDEQLMRIQRDPRSKMKEGEGTVGDKARDAVEKRRKEIEGMVEAEKDVRRAENDIMILEDKILALTQQRQKAMQALTVTSGDAWSVMRQMMQKREQWDAQGSITTKLDPEIKRLQKELVDKTKALQDKLKDPKLEKLQSDLLTSQAELNNAIKELVKKLPLQAVA